LATRQAGIAAIVTATILVALRAVAAESGELAVVSGWLLKGTVLGLAAAGLYSQQRVVPSNER
jgi:hypothetical protein